MIRKLFVFIICLLLILTSGCNSRSKDNIQKITPPNSTIIPIQGKWTITKVIMDKNSKTKLVNKWVGKSSEFSKRFVIVGDYILYQPSYKIRRLDIQEYLLFNHKTLGDTINLPTKDTDIITITGKDKFLCEIIKINDKEIILEIDNYNLYLRKISNTVDNKIPSNLNTAFVEEANNSKEDSIKRSGVLIGLRAPIYKKNIENKIEIQGYSYRTLLISARNRKLHPVVESSNIIFPRKSGFWEIEVNRSVKNTIINESIHSNNITTGETFKSINPTKPTKSIPSSTNIINYIGNDYVSIENIKRFNNQNLSKLKIVPIDSLPGLTGIKLSDVVSKDRIEAINKQLKNIYNSYDKEGAEILIENSNEDNLGFLRSAGHWYFYRRIDFLMHNKVYHEDYRLNIIPPTSLIYYDDLCIPWTVIKEKVPEAVDVYTSPNKDLAIILTKNNRLAIYEVNNGSLGNKPLEIIKTKQDEKIIMAEWATGSYSENWEKSFTNLRIKTGDNKKGG